MIILIQVLELIQTHVQKDQILLIQIQTLELEQEQEQEQELVQEQEPAQAQDLVNQLLMSLGKRDIVKNISAEAHVSNLISSEILNCFINLLLNQIL